MANTLDVRGLSCPEPVLRTLEALKSLNSGEILEVLVDTNVAKENVSRAVKSANCEILEIVEEPPTFRIKIKKG